jgi:hypothetical protein
VDGPTGGVNPTASDMPAGVSCPSSLTGGGDDSNLWVSTSQHGEPPVLPLYHACSSSSSSSSSSTSSSTTSSSGGSLRSLAQKQNCENAVHVTALDVFNEHFQCRKSKSEPPSRLKTAQESIVEQPTNL